MNKYKLAMLGTGKIANFHYNAFKSCGFDITHCASKLDSKRAKVFCEEKSIKNYYSNPFDMLDDYNNWDMVLLAIDTYYNCEYLDKIIESDKLCLVEKPVSTNLNFLKKYSNFHFEKVRVAYNRRFYKTVEEAKIFIRDNSPVLCKMELPEAINLEQENKYDRVLINSVHGIDMLRYLFGDIELKNNINHISPDGRISILEGDNDSKICLIMNWNSPSNFSLNIEGNNKRLELKPFEGCKIYEGMKIIEPTKDWPVRRYIPNEIYSSSSFHDTRLDMKPGFFEQAMEMKNILDGKKPLKSANLYDAYKTQKITQDILFKDR